MVSMTACIRYMVVLIPAVLASSDMSSPSSSPRCLLQAKKSPSRTYEHPHGNETDEEKKVSKARKKAKASLNSQLPDSSLQAPPEGGPFSDFFNKRIEGHGILKWLQYFPAYQQHLGKFIGKEVHIVEIGIQSGGSLDMWRSVFGPNTFVYGVDIDKRCKVYEDDHTKIFIGDQENPEFWENVTKEVPRIDILIDDGGHTPEQQIATLGVMLPRLSPDGVFITEDVHGANNPFWQFLNFEALDSPAGKHYTGLNSLVASVHIYPYLMVLERNGNAAGADMFRQLKTNPAETPLETRVAVAGTPTQAVDRKMVFDLKSVFPWLEWNNETHPNGEKLGTLMSGMQLPGWLFVRDGDNMFSFDAKWDSEADAFMSRILTDFDLMHEGYCCDWAANHMQKHIDSLHIYPHLLIVKSTNGGDRLVKAPKHGTVWIPYNQR